MIIWFEQKAVQFHITNLAIFITTPDQWYTHNQAPAFTENIDMYLYLYSGHCGIQWSCNRTPTTCWIIQTEKLHSFLSHGGVNGYRLTALHHIMTLQQWVWLQVDGAQYKTHTAYFSNRSFTTNHYDFVFYYKLKTTRGHCCVLKFWRIL